MHSRAQSCLLLLLLQLLQQQLVVAVQLEIGMSGDLRLPTTDTKRAFLNDFLDTSTPPSPDNPGARYANINRYFTLLMDCWPREDIASLMKSHPETFLRSNATSTSATPNYFNNYEIIDLGCAQSWDALAKEVWDNNVAMHRRISFHKLILILCDDSNSPALEKVLMNQNGRIKVSIMSPVIIARRVALGQHYELAMVYRISNERPLVYESYGNWSLKDGLTLIRQNAEMPTRRRDLQGLFFSIGFAMEVPETKDYYHTLKNPEVDTVIKQSYGLFECLVDLMNLTYDRHFYYSYGAYNATIKKWTGHSESLRIGETNFSGSPLVMIKQRVPFIDFVIQVSQKLTLKFFLKKPPMTYVRDIYSITFHSHVWYALFAMCVVFSGFIGYLLYVERIVFGNVTGDANDGVLASLESISQQGTVILTQTNAAEILLFTLSLACMFFYTAYSVYILKLLQTTASINTPKELLESPFEVGAEDAVYIRYFLKAEQDPIRKTLYETKITDNGFLDIKSGLERVRRGGYAFHVHQSPAYYYILKHFDISEQCSLQLIAARYLPFHLIYLPMPKASPYKKITKVGAIRIWETGLHSRRILRFYPLPKCSGVAPSFKIIETIDVQSVFVVFLVGTFIAAVVFVFELVHHHRSSLTLHCMARDKQNFGVSHNRTP